MTLDLGWLGEIDYLVGVLKPFELRFIDFAGVKILQVRLCPFDTGALGNSYTSAFGRWCRVNMRGNVPLYFAQRSANI